MKRDSRQERLRARWPSKGDLDALLAETGSMSAAARATGMKYSTLRHIIKRLGAQGSMHAEQMPPSAMRFGWSGEDHAALLLGAENYRVTGHESFDLIWHGLRVEVKTSRPVRAGPRLGSWFWMFNVARSRGKFDLLFCIGCNTAGLPVAYYMLPAGVVPRVKLSIPVNGRSKWAEFEWRPEPAFPPGWLA